MNYKDKFVGIKILGFCNGYFGRDSYNNKIIIASGDDWVVTKDNYGMSEFASFGNEDDMEELITSWNKEEEH